MIYEWEKMRILANAESAVQSKLSGSRIALLGIAYRHKDDAEGALIRCRTRLVGMEAVDVWQDILGDVTRFHGEAYKKYRAGMGWHGEANE